MFRDGARMCMCKLQGNSDKLVLFLPLELGFELGSPGLCANHSLLTEPSPQPVRLSLGCSLSLPNWLTGKPQESPCLHFPSAGITSVDHHVRSFHVASRG